jgi:hypothetical protein
MGTLGWGPGEIPSPETHLYKLIDLQILQVSLYTQSSASSLATPATSSGVSSSESTAMNSQLETTEISDLEPGARQLATLPISYKQSGSFCYLVK